MPSTSAILKAIQHPKRRQILEIISDSNNPIPYTKLLPICENSTGKLNYHLRTLVDIITKNELGYFLTDKGINIVKWLNHIISEGDRIERDKPSVIFSRIFPDRVLYYKYLVLYLLISTSLTLIPSFIVLKEGNIYVKLLISLLIIIIGIYYILTYYKSIWYIITDTEVIVHKGIVTQTQKIVPFRTITNIEVKQGFFDRIFKISTIEINTAGNSSLNAEEKLVGLIDSTEINETLLERIRLLNPPDYSSTSDSGKSQINGFNAILNELRELNKILNET